MQKIDYGDINKFLVSIGLVLIGLAILTPYFYLKEDFGLYIEKETIEHFQEPIKKLITSKQEQVIRIQEYIPWASLGLLILGFISSAFGLVRWFKRQAKLDEKFDKEIQKLDLEIKSLTPAEKEEKAKKEVQEIELEERVQSVILPEEVMPRPAYLDYIKIEQDITRVFEKYKSPNFEILSQQRLGNRFDVDLLLKAKSANFSDRIVEIKYFKKLIHLPILHKAIHQLSNYISYYKSATNKKVIPVLLVVFNEKVVNSLQILKYQESIKDYSKDIPNFSRLKVEFIPENKIDSYRVQNILQK